MNQEASKTASAKDGLFGWPSDKKTAEIILLPVPWEVTTSYGGGTSHGPDAILKASTQVDLFDLELGRCYESGFFLEKADERLLKLNDELRPKALAIRQQLEEQDTLDAEHKELLREVNMGCQAMVEWVYAQSISILKDGKIPAVIGGDHSSPEGCIRAVLEVHGGDIGLLHIDAHADLRNAYQGFERSHASIMYNVMSKELRPAHMVQVAIRDFSEEEYDLTQNRPDITTFFDADLKKALFRGTNWDALCKDMISILPEKVYVSFDIDGLSPDLCPGTGTPVPGGLSFDQANYLLGQLVESGKKIVGFDLNEVSPSEDGSEWDANVGARMLYKLCGWCSLSHR